MAKAGRYTAPLADVERIDGADLFVISGAQREAVRAARPRIILMALLFFMGYFGLVVRSVGLTIFDHKPIAVRHHAFAAPIVPRARITDRHGELLASTIETYSISIDRQYVDDAEGLIGQLAPIKGLKGEKSLQKALRGKTGWALLGTRLTPAAREAVFALGLPGVEIKAQQTRYYPRGEFASHLLGWVNADGAGVVGVDRAFDQQLTEHTDEPLQLSIDTKVQFALEDELKNAMAAYRPRAALGVVTRVKTGEVMAMAGQPLFDPNAFGKYTPNERRNRAATDVYELGSVFKPLTLAMAFDQQLIAPDDMFDVVSPLIVNTKKINDMHRNYHPMSAHDILVESSNKGAALIALKVGGQMQRQYLSAFGLLQPAQIELRESANYYMASSRWRPVKTATIGYGHGLGVTALAFVQAMGAIANDGKIVPLTLLARAPDYQPQSRQVVSPQAANTVVDIMRDVVRTGTGKKANVAGYDVAGKTGSAEKFDNAAGRYAKDRNISSFVAVFPVDDPQYLVFILLDEPQGDAQTSGWETAGWNAAPITGRLISRIGPMLKPKLQTKRQLASAKRPSQ